MIRALPVRRMAVLLAVVLLATMPARAEAILPSCGLYGGLTRPLGAEGDSWAVRGDLFLRLAPGVSFGPEVGSYDFVEDLTQPDCGDCHPISWHRVTSYGAALRIGVPLPEVHPYLIAGLASYRWSGLGQPDDRQFGMSGGVGLDLGSPTNFVNLAFEGRWHGKATTHPTWNGWRNLYTLMAGLRFQIF